MESTGRKTGVSTPRSSLGFAYKATTPDVQLAEGSLQSNGGGQAHNNMQPYLTLNYIIALTGTYPSRS